MLISQAIFSTAWNYLKTKPSYNKVLQSSLCSLALPPAKPSKYMLIMPEPLIMQESVSGRSWTSKVFNTVITLDTYQFFMFYNIEMM